MLQEAALVGEELRSTWLRAGRSARSAGSTVGHVVGGLSVGTSLGLAGMLQTSAGWWKEAGGTHSCHGLNLMAGRVYVTAARRTSEK